ncbi:MAG: M81 family metallopeptidase [Chloroflexi bacterium]|nr:M81 family metallopeptidase [Chloroflexota bacterium]
MRIAAFGIHHETNTFSTFQVDLQAFQSSGLQREGILRGDQIREFHGDTESCFGGYFEAADKYGFELVPLLFAATDPAGTISSEACESILGEALQMLRDQGPWDGVILNQMGAAVSQEFPDMDGEVARRTRELVGPDVPVIMTLDLHANVSQQMADETDALFIYRTNPHLDARPLAVKACKILVKIINGEIDPVSALEMPPMVISIMKQDTSEEPMTQVIDAVVEAQDFADIVDTSTGEGYPWSDVNECGTAFYALADGNPEAARNAARYMAQRAWSLREELSAESGPSAADAIRDALATPEGPVLLLDAGDNIGAGSAGDSTFILQEALKQGATSYLTTIRDTEAVATCVNAGIGSDVTLKIGGKQDDLHGEPIEVTGKVVTISDGKFEDPEPTHAGWRYFDGGTTVVLQTTAGPTIVLVSTRVGNVTRQQFYSLDLRPEEFHIIVAKGVVSPRPAFQKISKKMIVVNTAGATSAALSSFDYRRRRRPLYPFEPDAAYPSD